MSFNPNIRRCQGAIWSTSTQRAVRLVWLDYRYRADPSRRAEMSDLINVGGASVGHDQLAVRSTSVPVAGEDSAQAPRRAPLVMMALALIGLAVAPYDPYAIYNGQLYTAARRV